jgi:hypothetical protein
MADGMPTQTVKNREPRHKTQKAAESKLVITNC